MGGMGGGFGSGGMGGGFGGIGGTGANRGGTGFGNSGFGNNQGNNQGGFVGRNTNPNQFVGQNQMTGGNQGLLNSGNARQNLLGALGNRSGAQNSSQNFNPSNSGQNSAPMLRARQKVAFDFPKPPHTEIQTVVQTRITKLSTKNPALKDVTFLLDHRGTLVLQGEVASESAARLAAKLVRLEPGVKAVRSELTYPPSAAEE